MDNLKHTDLRNRDQQDRLFDPIAARKARLERCQKLLPAWFVPRMMDDTWVFGLLLSTGKVLAIEHIDEVHRAADGSLWIDVDMCGDPVDAWAALHAPTSRTRASVNVAHIVCALELSDT
jgi:hypothetical protein